MNPCMINESSNIQAPYSQTNGAMPGQQQQQYTAPLILPATNGTENDRNTDIPRPKRSRAKRSCDLCRKRKTKCNADVVQPCNTCQTAGVQCQFLVEQKKRGPNARNYIGSLENRLKRLEGLLQKAQASDGQDTAENDGHDASSSSTPPPQAATAASRHKQSSGGSGTSSNNSISNDDEDDGFLEDCIDENQPMIRPTAPQQSNEPSTSHVCTELSSVDPSLELVEYFNQLQLSDYERTRYIGGSAGYHMIDQHLFKRNWRHRIRSHPNWVIQKVNDDDTEHVIIKAEEMRHKPQFMPGTHALLRFSVLQDIPLLTSELVDCMIHAFFNHIHPHCPVVNKVSFLEQYYFQNPHAPDEYLLYAICAVSTLFLSMEDDLVTGTTVCRETVVAVRNSLREKANKILEVVYKRSQISTVQTLVLLSMFVSMAGDDDDDSVHWFITGTAIRMAQDLGLHRSSTRWLLPENEIELRRRIWYAVYIMDKWIAAELGRPVAILDEEFDVELPSVYEITSIYHSESRQAEVRHMKPALLMDAETALDEKRPVHAAFLHMISLARTLGQVLVSLYSPKMQYAARRNIYLVDTLNMALTKWKMSIPPDLQCEDNKPDKAFPNGGMMHIFYNCVVLLLHRPFITDHDSSNINHALQALSACTAAAINIIDMVEELEKMGVICMPWCMVGYATFQAAIIFLFNARSDNEYIRRQGAKNLMRCAYAYRKDECMSKSRTAKVLCQLTRRFSIPIVSDEEGSGLPCLSKEDRDITPERPTRKRDYEGDSIRSHRSSPDKQPRTAPLLGNTSEEAIYFTSLPRDMNSSNRSFTSPEHVENNNSSNSTSSTPRNDTASCTPPVGAGHHLCNLTGTAEDTIMEMFYPAETGINKTANTSSSSSSSPKQQQSATEPKATAAVNTATAPNYDNSNANGSRPNSGLFSPSNVPMSPTIQLPEQKPYDAPPVHAPTGSNTTPQQQQFNFVDTLLMEQQQQQSEPQQEQDIQAAQFEQCTNSLLNHTDGLQFDIASLTSDVPMWSLPSGVTWSEWDSLLNDSQGIPQQDQNHH